MIFLTGVITGVVVLFLSLIWGISQFINKDEWDLFNDFMKKKYEKMCKDDEDVG